MLSLGAIDKNTGEYASPKSACKKSVYKCPDCNKDLILCRGKIRIPHFRHKTDTINPCNHYNHPSESQIHKDGKMLLKFLIEKNFNLEVNRMCYKCNNSETTIIEYDCNKEHVELEYRFDYNGLKIADVACINNKNTKYIFEIYNTHKTLEENRPEPWFEINAEHLLNSFNETSSNEFQIQCIREKECSNCSKERINIIPDMNNANLEQNMINKTNNNVKLTEECFRFFKEVKECVKTKFNDRYIKYIKETYNTTGSMYQIPICYDFSDIWFDFLFDNISISNDFRYFTKYAGDFYTPYYNWSMYNSIKDQLNRAEFFKLAECYFSINNRYVRFEIK